MENILAKLNRKENVVEITQALLTKLKVSITNTTIQNDLENHPDYPSLLSISDTLTSYGVDNVSVRVAKEKLSELPLPIIVPIQIPTTDFISEQKFTIVDSIEKGVVKYLDPETNSWANASEDMFFDIWKSGFAMVIDADEATEEVDFKVKKKSEKLKSVGRIITFASLPLLLLLYGVVMLIDNDSTSVFPNFAFFVVTVLGAVISGLIIWYEIDEYNPVVKQICKSGRQINCGAVLNSPGSQILGIKWSSIGFSYFVAGSLMLISGSIANTLTFSALSWLNVLAIPYIFFSVYYQWRVTRQWCILCLAIQGLLLFQFVISVSGGLLSLNFPSPQLLAQMLIYFSIPMVVVLVVVKAFQKSKKGDNDSRELKKLQYSKKIFDALLPQQKRIHASVEGLGISLGNPSAKNRLVQICSPYCMYCASTHRYLMEILQLSGDVHIQIIFTASKHPDDPIAPPVRLFMAIQKQEGEAAVSKALTEWYTMTDPDFFEFSKNYSFIADKVNNDYDLEAMSRWCIAMDIQFTPTFFINSYQLPEIYRASDLKYFLAV